MPAGRGLLARVRDPRIAGILRLAASEAGRRRLQLYLVGGCVRDLLLGVPMGDLDLAVEGDPAALARAVAAAAGGSARSITPFRTCRIDLPDGAHIDLAMARSETYRAPAALPSVAPAPIEEDLLRRDFTVNSMAVRLTGARRGTLLDPSNGRLDLNRRLLRLHHPLSLVDDPTRAYRGARYAARFSLRPAPSWGAAIEAAARRGAFLSLTAARLGREVRLIWLERSPAKVLALCARWSLLHHLHPGLRWSEGLAAAVRRGSRAKEKDAAVSTHLLPALMAWSLPARSRGRLCDRLGLSGSARREVLIAAAAPDRWVRISFAGASKLARCPELARLAARAAAAPEDRRRLDRLAARWRRSAPRLTGDDLIALGLARGPRLGRLLLSLRRARFEGRLRTRADELRWIRGHS